MTALCTDAEPGASNAANSAVQPRGGPQRRSLLPPRHPPQYPRHGDYLASQGTGTYGH